MILLSSKAYKQLQTCVQRCLGVCCLFCPCSLLSAKNAKKFNNMSLTSLFISLVLWISSLQQAETQNKVQEINCKIMNEGFVEWRNALSKLLLPEGASWRTSWKYRFLKALAEVQNNYFSHKSQSRILLGKQKENNCKTTLLGNVIHEVSSGIAASQHNSLKEEILYQANQKALSEATNMI